MSATTSHDGGEQVAAGSADYASVAAFLRLVLAEAGAPQRHGAVTTLSARGLIRMPANHFDLEGRTVSFTPNDAGRGYGVTVGELDWLSPTGTETTLRHDSEYVEVELPFAFPFAGQTWTRIYANTNGNISFHRPEGENWPQRNPWSNGTMRSVAAAIDSRSAAGLEAMIAVLWATYDDVTITVDSASASTVVTWRAVRNGRHDVPGIGSLGESTFQVRLHSTGAVDLGYLAVPERDGIVGLFHGLADEGQTVVSVNDERGDVATDLLDIVGVELVDRGSVILVRLTLAVDVPAEVEGTISYRIMLRYANRDCEAWLSVTAHGHRSFWGHWCGESPNVVGHTVRGRTIEMPVSKTLLAGELDAVEWSAGAVWWERGEFEEVVGHGSVTFAGAVPDLDQLDGKSVGGNGFEVFHYPSIGKHDTSGILSAMHERVPANAEIAVVLTDFRFDDLFGGGPSTGAINVPVLGIGRGQETPAPADQYGSDSLLVSMAPSYAGAPRWAETGMSDGRAIHNFARGVTWAVHEAVHRWAATLSFRNPRSGVIEELQDDGSHWSQYLHAPAIHEVSPAYVDSPYVEHSVMGGHVWVDNGDGTFTRNPGHWLFPSGLSALDLYVMGMIPAAEVPDTFILRDVQETDDWSTVEATKVPVRIEDIVAVMGPRSPAADASRKEFRLGVYLLHEEGREPHAAMLERAQGVAEAVGEYFGRATGGRMRVVPTGDVSGQRVLRGWRTEGSEAHLATTR